jgi:hypothetical protein
MRTRGFARVSTPLAKTEPSFVALRP